MLLRVITSAVTLATTSSLAFAAGPVPKLGSGIPLYEASSESDTNDDVLESFSMSYASRADTYRIGDEWGKKPVTNGDLIASPQLLRAAQATASLGGATAFYLGKFNGEAVLATNHHVCPELYTCIDQDADFPLLGISARVVKSLGTWTKIDLSLVVVELNAEQAAKLDKVAANFDFASPLKPGQLLFTAGFGVAENPRHQLVANQDKDCIVFSREGDFRVMFDPDRLNPGTYDAWSFANGCDVSHGDSGSAMVDRRTGHPVGIIWTGKIPKSETVQSSSQLEPLVGSDDPAVWSELSYGVPAVKIKEYLAGLLEEGSIPQMVRDTVAAVVGVEGSL